MGYKYGFVDKNSYLTYTDEPNKTDADVFGVYSDNPESADDEGGGRPVSADITLAEGESIYGVYNIVHLIPES